MRGIQKGILTYVRLIKYAGKESPAKVLTKDKSTTNRFIFCPKIRKGRLNACQMMVVKSSMLMSEYNESLSRQRIFCVIIWGNEY